MQICFTPFGSTDILKYKKLALKNKNTAYAIIDLCNYGIFKGKKIETYDSYEFLGYNYHTTHLSYFLNDSTGAFKVFEMINAILILDKIFYDKHVKVYANGHPEPLALIAVWMIKKIFNKKLDVNIANEFIGYKQIINIFEYNQKDFKSYIIPGILKYCDVDDLKKWNKIK